MKAAAFRLKPRGVYALPIAGTAGEQILVAVDTQGRRIAERLVPPGADDRADWTELRALLERRDPVAVLQLEGTTRQAFRAVSTASRWRAQ